MSQNREAAIARLRSTFGNQIDKEVLESVLEVTDGDVNAAISFLQAEEGGYAFDPAAAQANGGVPADYPGQNRYVGYGRNANNTNKTTVTDTSLENTIKNLFIQESTFQEHYDAQVNHYATYTAVVLLFTKFNVDIAKGAKTRMLAACWARHDFIFANYLLSLEDNPPLPQVLGALNLLDAGRKVRQLEKRITKLTSGGQNVKPKTITKLKATIHDLSKEAHIGSVSGALAKRLRKWVKTIPAEKLTFFALNLPKAPWKDLADLVHLNPKDDFQCPFLEIAFDSEPAPGSMLAECAKIDADNCVTIAKKWHVPYSYLRLQVKPLPEELKAAVASYAPLDTLIWYHEELACSVVDNVIGDRLSKGEQPRFGYGKLMERLLYLKRVGAPFFKYLEPIADKRLRTLHLALESPVTVLGDASFSMDVAIRCATIIGSVLTLLTSAELKFFHSLCFDPVVLPTNVSQVLKVATETKADGLTAPACALVNYYNQKKIVKFFIVVTDEIENEKFQGMYFPDLFLKYHREVYPARIVFVSFLENPSEKGRMVKALENMGIEPILFRLDSNRPDLQKLDSLLGLLACESSQFTSQIRGLAAEVKAKGLPKMLENLNDENAEKMDFTHTTNTTTTTSTTTATEEMVLEQTNTNSNNNNSIDVNMFLKEEKHNAEVRAADKEKEAQNEKLCVICEENPVNMVLLDCGHLILCDKCAPAIVQKDSCPLCRAPVLRAHRIYHNV